MRVDLVTTIISYINCDELCEIDLIVKSIASLVRGWPDREPLGKQHFGIILLLQALQSRIIGAKKDWRFIADGASIASINFRIYDKKPH